jgi:hypothetical protein
MKTQHPAKCDTKQTQEFQSKDLQTIRGTPESRGQRDRVDENQLEDWQEAESDVLEPEHPGGFRRPQRVAR